MDSRKHQEARGGGVKPVRPVKPVRTPARPGPGPYSAAALRALDLTVRRRVEGVMAGEHRATAFGVGTELAQIRPYEPGDDVRRIDWNVTARTRVPHVRVHVAERVLDTWLVLDTSPSMAFGTADRRKADVAEGAALAVAYLAARRGNRLGLVTFGERNPTVIPPRSGGAAHRGLLITLQRQATGGDDRPSPGRAPGKSGKAAPVGATSLEEALRRIGRLARRRGLIVIVSDFRGPLGAHQIWRRPLLQLAGRHDVMGVEIRDPREMALPNVGDLALVDPETGRHVRVDTASRRLRERFAAAAAAERAEVAAVLRKAGVRHVVLATAGDWLRPLAGLLRAPHRRRSVLPKSAKAASNSASPSRTTGAAS
jgi:uncharacterized protein (DUF58 family)